MNKKHTFLSLVIITISLVADGRNYPDALSSFGLLKSKNLGLKLVDGARPYTSNRQVVYTFGGK